jgi:hypothetical protein
MITFTIELLFLMATIGIVTYWLTDLVSHNLGERIFPSILLGGVMSVCAGLILLAVATEILPLIPKLDRGQKLILVFIPIGVVVPFIIFRNWLQRMSIHSEVYFKIGDNRNWRPRRDGTQFHHLYVTLNFDPRTGMVRSNFPVYNFKDETRKIMSVSKKAPFDPKIGEEYTVVSKIGKDFSLTRMG